MPIKIKHVLEFHTGMEVSASCYSKGCEDIQIPVILGETEYFHPHFHGPGAGHDSLYQWDDSTQVRCFNVVNQNKETLNPCCPRCKTTYAIAFVVGNYFEENKGLPLIFLYERE
ncbi:MAG: hypothetical protein WC662_02515 [Candidatus Paceibacterota bacterium]|jgi:hypothetical protein